MKPKLALRIALAMSMLVLFTSCDLSFDLDAPISSLEIENALTVYDSTDNVSIQFSFTGEQDRHLCQYNVAKDNGTSFYVVEEGEVELQAGVVYKHTDISSYYYQNGHYRFSFSVLLEKNGSYDSPPFLQDSVDFWVDPTGPSGSVTFSPNGGTYSSAQQIVLDHPEFNAIDGSPSRIFYTKDGSDPTSSSSKYEPGNPITISGNTNLKAIAIDLADRCSGISSATFEIDLQAPAQPVANPGSGTYGTNAVELTHPEFVTPTGTSVRIYYTLDETTPNLSSDSTDSEISLILGDGSTQLRAVTIDDAGNTSSELVADYVIDTIAPDEPTLVHPPPDYSTDYYDTDFDLSITCNDIPAGTPVQIFYTIDGSTPDRSAILYSVPINISSNTEFNAIAIDQVGNESLAVSETFTFLEVGPINPTSCPIDSSDHFFNLSGYFGIFFDSGVCIPSRASIYVIQGAAQVPCTIVDVASTELNLVIGIDGQDLIDASMVAGDATITVASNVNSDSESIAFSLTYP